MIDREVRREVVQEPVGIVISQGRTTDVPPRFAAFVWAPVPETEVEAPATKAA